MNVNNVLTLVLGLIIGVGATWYFTNDPEANRRFLEQIKELEKDKARLEEQLKQAKKEELQIVERVRNREKSKDVKEVLAYWRSAKHYTPGPY
jgi:hypothetical protein